MQNSERKEFIAVFSAVAAAALIFSFALFGITGAGVVFGLIIESLPFYFILNNFGIGEGEKIVFSLLLGLTLFPSLAYLLGYVMPFRIAIAITFTAVAAAAIVMRKFKRRNSTIS